MPVLSALPVRPENSPKGCHPPQTLFLSYRAGLRQLDQAVYTDPCGGFESPGARAKLLRWERQNTLRLDRPKTLRMADVSQQAVRYNDGERGSIPLISLVQESGVAPSKVIEQAVPLGYQRLFRQ